MNRKGFVDYLDVLCGTGHHTQNRKAVLLQTVCDFLAERNCKFRILPAGGRGGAVRLYFN